MADTKIRVLSGGVPVVDAQIIVGAIVGELLESDEDGEVEFELESGWRGFEIVHISAGGTTATALVDIQDGEVHEVEIASVE